MLRSRGFLFKFVICFVFLCTEGKDCVVISEEGRGVDYKSGKDEVQHLNSLTAPNKFLAFRKLSLLQCVFSDQEAKSFSFDQVVTVDNIQVQKSASTSKFTPI